MTPNEVRIQIRCARCTAPFRLSQEQYRDLVKHSQVALSCPHCGNGFEYSPVATAAKKSPPPIARSRPATGETKADLMPAAANAAPAEAALPSAPEFPPPPFAPLAGGTPAPAETPMFAPLGGSPLTPRPDAAFSQATAPSAGSETPRLTLNDRWKQLPPWVQWTVIGVLIVVLAIIIFAIPTGGGSTPPAPETSRVSEQRRQGTEPDRPSGEKKPQPRDRRAEEASGSQER